MSQPAAHSTVAELLNSFTNATPDRLDAEYQRLVGALWDNGNLTELATPATPALVAHLGRVGADRQGYLIVLLGLLAEAEHPAADGQVLTAIRQGLDRYLDLLSRHANSQPLTLALLYLLGHFPDDRDRILAAVEDRGLDQDDLTRLDRNLRQLDPDDVVLGRVWPSPAEWTLSEAERESDQGWIRALSPAQVAATWEGDTRMLLGYSGAKAYWALRNGNPTVVDDDSYGDMDATAPAPVDIEAFTRHADAFRCPNCEGRLEFAPSGVQCVSCVTRYSSANGVLDLSSAAADEDDPDDVLQNAAVMHRIGLYYEIVLRPGFLRLMGSNWGGQVAPSDEDAYLVENARPVDGPVLDLAAGAGRWTAVLAETLGADRVIALDLNRTMLTWLRGRLPDVPAVQASALTLPFADATLGAVNCWNALQAMPDPAAVVAEVGRCLRPGGTFTLLTFAQSPDRIYRYFQNSFRGPGFPDGMPLFEPDEVMAWLDKAGMAVRAESSPGTFVFVTAERIV